MSPFTVDGHDILLVCAEGGEIAPFQGVCPHQDISAVGRQFDGKKLICRAHLWQFDANGKGINPTTAPWRFTRCVGRRRRHHVSTEGVELLCSPTAERDRPQNPAGEKP